MRIPRKPGTYMLHHVPTGYFYVGSSSDVADRIGHHRRLLNRYEHKNPILNEIYTDWNDIVYTYTIFKDREEALDEEQRLLDLHIEDELCCNIAADARVTWARGMPQSVRDKIILANTGRVFGEDFRRMRSETMLGVRRTDKTKKKISESLSGRTRPQEVCEKISLGRTGWDPSQETRGRMSESAKLRPVDLSKIDAMREAKSRKVSINGVVYPSIAEASRSLDIPAMTIKQRTLSQTNRFEDWFLV